MSTKRQGEEVDKMEFEDVSTEFCVKRCTHCPRIFARPQTYTQYVTEYKEKQARKHCKPLHSSENIVTPTFL